VLQHPQKSSKLGQRQLLKQRRHAAEMRQQQRQEASGTRLMAKKRLETLVSPRSPRSATTGSLEQVPLQGRLIKPSKVQSLSSKLPSKQLRRVQVPSRRRKGIGWVGNFFKLGFFGLGLSATIGTAIAMLHPVPHPGTLANSLMQIGKKGQPTNLSGSERTNQANLMGMTFGMNNLVLAPNKELTEAKTKISSLAAAQSDLVPGLFIYNPETETHLNMNGDKPFPAASTIKFPVLVAFFQDVDAKRVRLDEELTMRKDLIASESGDMQYLPVGSKFSALKTVDMMITISDNTATNMLIDRLGGMAALNQRFKGWGLTQTAIRNPLPDLQGTNTVSPRDLSILMLKVAQGEFLTPHSRDRLLEIMRNTVTNTLLSPGLGQGAKIAHKTGDIGSVVGDVGLIEMPNGQRYVATAMVQRPHNDPRAQELIRQMSRTVYQAIEQATPSTPVATTTAPSPPVVSQQVVSQQAASQPSAPASVVPQAPSDSQPVSPQPVTP
jgi:beta-lactamase class A